VKRRLQRFCAKGKRAVEKRLKGFRSEARRGKPSIGRPNIKIEVSEKIKAVSYAGIALAHRLVCRLGLVEALNGEMRVLKQRNPYHESDHVLTVAYNAMCDATAIEDIEILRQSTAFLDAIGAVTIPDPTTVGDHLRRFSREQIIQLMDIFNGIRQTIWRRQSEEFRRVAKIDVDGVFFPTYGECKEGVDINHKGQWGYHPLLVSLANSREPLYLVNRSGNRPSHEEAPEFIDRAVKVCRAGGFAAVRVRGDTDFGLTKHFDQWTDDHVTFVFGFDSKEVLKELAEYLPEEAYDELIREHPYAVQTSPRRKQPRHKDGRVKARKFRKLRTVGEEVAEFFYRPTGCDRDYRVVVLRKAISVTKGQRVLLPETRYFFFITNDYAASGDEIVLEANGRCNQENLGAQFKAGGVCAFRAPSNTLLANWAYMVMVSLAWSIKAWLALELDPEEHEEERQELMTCEFKHFVNFVMRLPAQVCHKSRRVIVRVLDWHPGLALFLTLAETLDC